MCGAFRSGLGVYSHEACEGRMILIRFQWRSLGPDEARWEQAFSADGGANWETNWIMEFMRTGQGDWAAKELAAPSPDSTIGRLLRGSSSELRSRTR